MLATILGWLAGIISVLSFAAVGILHLRSAVTLGHIIRIDEERAEDGHELYYRAIFAYEVEGATFEARSLEAHSAPVQPVGAEATIRYSLDRHEWAAEDRLLAIYFIPMMTGIMAGCMYGWSWFLCRRIAKEEGPISEGSAAPQRAAGPRLNKPVSCKD